MNADFISAIQELGKEKGIDPELLFQAVDDALVAAYKKNTGTNQNVRVEMNKETGEIHVYAQRTVVEGEADGSAGRLVQGDLEHLRGDANDVGLLVAHPAPADHAAVDAVVHGAGVLDVELVLPAVVVGVDEVPADEAGHFLGLGGFEGIGHGGASC